MFHKLTDNASLIALPFGNALRDKFAAFVVPYFQRFFSNIVLDKGNTKEDNF
jgi:hypothetical protein